MSNALPARVCQRNVRNKLSVRRLGVALTTVQRYETGEIYIPSEAIYKSIQMLNTSVSFLYDEEEGQKYASSNINRTGLMVAVEITELPNDTIRKNIYHLVRSINKVETEQEIKLKIV